MAGGGTGSCDAKPKRSDAEKLAFARGALTIIRLKKDMFDNTEDRMEERDLVIAMDDAAEAALEIIDDEDTPPDDEEEDTPR